MHSSETFTLAPRRIYPLSMREFGLARDREQNTSIPGTAESVPINRLDERDKALLDYQRSLFAE